MAIVCLTVVALWTVRALRDGQTSDMGLAWLAGDLTWRTGHPEVLFSWTGTPLLAALMALVSRVADPKTSTAVLTLLNASITIGLVSLLFLRLRRWVARPWLWGISLGLVSFAPLMSTVWWKQINLIALVLGVAGFDRLRRTGFRSGLGSMLIGLSVALKPLLVLLPFVLAARRRTRRAGVLSIVWLAAASMAALALAAWHAHQLSALDPWTAISNFAQKSDPNRYGYTYSADNFAPLGTMLRLGGLGDWRLYQVSALMLVTLLGLWGKESLRDHGVTSWEAFAFISVLSVMVSPIDWSHYQLMLAPLLVVLVVSMSREGGSPAEWLGLTLGFVLASLVWRPDGTLTGTLHTLVAQGRLPPDTPFSGAAVPIETISQGAQYVLIVTAILRYTRLRARGRADAGWAVPGEPA